MKKLISFFIMSAFLLTGCHNSDNSSKIKHSSETVSETTTVTTAEQNTTVTVTTTAQNTTVTVITTAQNTTISEEKETTIATSTTVPTTTEAVSSAQEQSANTTAVTQEQDDTLFFEETEYSSVQEQQTQETLSEQSANDVVELPIIPIKQRKLNEKRDNSRQYFIAEALSAIFYAQN